MSGIFFGWWRISRSPVLPCVSRRVWRPTDKFGSSERTVCRLLTSLVAAEESVLVASKIRWASQVFVAASHQTRLDTRSKARRPIKVGIKGRGRSGRSRDSNPACLCCSSAHLVQCEPDEASSFTNPNVGPGTYASLRLKLDAWSSAVQGGQRRQKCSSPTRR